MNHAAAFPFKTGNRYSRRDVYSLIGIPLDTKGGNWDTGYNRHGNDWFIFCNVGTAGRTGHNYNNRFIGDDLLWYRKTGSTANHPSIQTMIKPAGKNYLFYRESDRQSFVYAGEAHAKLVTPNSVPVEILWSFSTDVSRVEELPEEDNERITYAEGATKQITVNAFERDPNARRKCIEHCGTRCCICDFDFGETFGDLGNGFIHIHHLIPLSEIGNEYRTDPIEDLRPVCPNCHAMLHRLRPALSIDELKAIRANQHDDRSRLHGKTQRDHAFCSQQEHEAGNDRQKTRVLDGIPLSNPQNGSTGKT